MARHDRLFGELGLRRVGPRLVQVRPGLLREVLGQRHHVVAGHVLDDGLHLLVLAIAELVVAQLQIKVALVLAPDHRDQLVDRHALLAMAGGAQRGLILDAVLGLGQRGHGHGGSDRRRPERAAKRGRGKRIGGLWWWIGR